MNLGHDEETFVELIVGVMNELAIPTNVKYQLPSQTDGRDAWYVYLNDAHPSFYFVFNCLIILYHITHGWAYFLVIY